MSEGTPPTDDQAGEVAAQGTSSGGALPADSRLDAVRKRLEEVQDLPVEDRAAVFEDVNEAIVEELGAMEDL